MVASQLTVVSPQVALQAKARFMTGRGNNRGKPPKGPKTSNWRANPGNRDGNPAF